MIDKRDLTIDVRNDLAQLLIGLRSDSAIGLASLNRFRSPLRLGSQHALVPPGPIFKIAMPKGGEIDIRRIMKVQPWLRAIEGVMGVGKANPSAKRFDTLFFSHSIARSAVQVVLCHAAGSIECQVCAAPGFRDFGWLSA